MTRAEAAALLGVGEAATAEELKKAYKRKALRAHPDKGGSKEEFQRLAEAYKCLADAREGAAAAATADVDDDDWAAEIFQSVFTFNLHHMPSLIAQLYGRVELSAAALNAVAEAAHDGAHVVVLSQSGTAAGGHKRTDCQRVAFFLRNSRMLPAAADPKRVRFGFFAWRQLAPPPPEDQSDADAAAAPRDGRSSDHEPKRGDRDRDGRGP
ncbi:hypothetical protein JL722_11041 [Aureococcus anophagefferens]|nr:hypothetical protein JL722_11041 [Aureococcus anophagefferens]